jgi:hypothetical protein
MPLDPLNQSVDAINTPLVVDLPTRHEPELFFDADRFLAYLEESYNSFDILTYSLSRSSTPPLTRIDRLITNLPLYLCYNTELDLQAAYLGSQNLSHGTQINLMYRADYLHNQPLLSFFNVLWNFATKNENHNRNHSPRRPTLSYLR